MSDPRESEFKEQLVLLRDLFRMTGVLHEAQRIQLLYLPRVCIGHSTKAEVAIQFVPADAKKPRILTYKVEVAGPEPKNLRKLLAKLDEWTKFIVGDDFEIVVEYGKKKYRSPGKKSPNGNRTHQAREPSRTAQPRRTGGVREVPPQRQSTPRS